MPFQTTYGSREQSLAEAIADALIARGIGLGGSSGGTAIGGSTASKQDEQSAILEAIRTLIPAGYSTEATLNAIRALIPSASNPVLARSMRVKWRDDFTGTVLSNDWEVLQTGAGQTITVSGSELQIATGVTANAQTVIRSTRKFTIPFRVFAIAMLSQRIVNQEFYIEIIDPTGTHYAQWLFDGINTNTGRSLTANNNSTTGATNVSLPNPTGNYNIFEIDTFPDEINFFQRTVDALSARGASSSKTRQIPDPNLEYHLQIRVRNLATAPTSSTTFRFDSIAVQDIEEIAAEVTGGRGGGGSNQSIPVLINNTPIATTIGASVNLNIQDTLASNTEFNASIAANTSTTTSARDTNSNRNTVRGWVFTDQSGTLLVEQSIENITWRQTHTFSIAGNATQATIYEFKLVARYFRFRYTNGATAATTLNLISSQFSIGA